MHPMGIRHKYERRQKRNSRKSKSTYIVFLDKLTYIVGIIGPFTVFPQVYVIFSTRSASGVSLTTWLLISLMTLPWILYGIAHKSKLILTCFALWGSFDLMVVLGVLLYG